MSIPTQSKVDRALAELNADVAVYARRMGCRWGGDTDASIGRFVVDVQKGYSGRTAVDLLYSIPERHTVVTVGRFETAAAFLRTAPILARTVGWFHSEMTRQQGPATSGEVRS